MKRLAVILLFSFLVVSLGCSKPLFSAPAPLPTQVPVNYYYENYLSLVSYSDIFEEACAGKANWVGEAGATGYVTTYNRTINPTTVKISASRVIEIEGYYVNFHPTDPTIVFKNGLIVTGIERDEAIRLALKKVEGVTTLKVTFQITRTENGYTTDNPLCSLP